MRNNRHAALGLIAAGALVFAALGCRSLQNLSAGDSNASQRNSGFPNFGKQQTAASDPLTEKTNLYIKSCVNNYSNRIMDSYERYASWQKNPEAGPTGKETNVYTLYEPNGDGQDCVDAINTAKNSEPDLPDAEANADKYAAALKEVVARIKEIHPYYDRADYKDDNFARAKEFHPILLKAFKDFEAAHKAFLVDIDKLEDTVAQNNLKDYEGKPELRAKYLITESSIKSKRILSQVTQNDFDKIDAATLQPLVEDFEKTVNDLKALPTESQEPNKAIEQMNVRGYVSAAEDFLKTSKELMRRVRDQKPFSRSELMVSEMTVGTPQNVVREYNDLIGAQNRID